MTVAERLPPSLQYGLRLARRLSRGPWRLHTLIVVWAFPWIPIGVRQRLAWIRVTLPSGSRRRFWFEDLTQAQALAEVLIDGDYDIPLDRKVRTIVDLGANAGQSSIFLRDRYPQASILAVEADPDTARLAAWNLRTDPNATVSVAAVTDHDGTVPFTRLPGYSWGSNVVSAWSSSDSPTVSVRSATLGTLLAEHSLDTVDLLKVDIEGAEIMALTSDASLARVDCVVGEVHPSLLGIPADEAMRMFQEHGGFDRGWMHRDRVFVLQRNSADSH